MTAGPRFEVIPLAGIAEEVRRHLPPPATITVTASPRQGLAATLQVATDLVADGYHVVPHLAARLVRDQVELKGILDGLMRDEIRETFVIAGDPVRPAGEFTGALDLLQAMADIGHDLTVGIAGYPETHPNIDDDVTIQAMRDKQVYASYLVSQMCFDAEVLLEWVEQVRARGVLLPIRVGMAGPARTSQLLKISTRIGVGQSVRTLTHHRGGVWHLAGPGRWRPDELLQQLAPAFDDERLQGLHLYTFNAVQDTIAWWQDVTTRLPR